MEMKKTCAQIAKECIDDLKDLTPHDIASVRYWLNQFKACSDFPSDPEVLEYEADYSTSMRYPTSDEIFEKLKGKRWKIKATEVLSDN